MDREPISAQGWVEVSVVLLLLVGVALCAPLLFETRRRGCTIRVKCSNNLRQLGLAALQYSDDKRYFPHVGPTLSLDGDVTSGDTLRIVHSMIWGAYFDDPEGLICPQSVDVASPQSPRAEDNLREWDWGGNTYASISQSPIFHTPAAPNGSLASTTEISYGWTRRGLNSNVRSDTLMAADRAVIEDESSTHGTQLDALYGNHVDGWNVMQADAAVDFWAVAQDPYPGRILVGTTDRREGALAIKSQMDRIDIMGR